MYASPAQWSIGDALSAGWNRFWPNILPMALYALVVVVVNAVLYLVSPVEAGWFVSGVYNMVQFLVAQMIAIGWIGLALDITDGTPVSADRVMSRFGIVVPYLIAALLFTIGLQIGLFLLIVPGIIFALVFMFYGFHIVDTRNMNPIEAFQRSARLTKGHRGKLFGLWVLLVLINILGALLLLVGLLFTMGISLLTVTHVYRQLSGGQRNLA